VWQTLTARKSTKALTPKYQELAARDRVTQGQRQNDSLGQLKDLTVKKLTLSLTVIWLTASAGPASAGLLYSNGPLNGTGDSFTISDGYAVSDSFTPSGPATVTSFDFTVWNFSFDVTTNIDWSIGATVGGSQQGSGAGATLSGVLDFTNGPWAIYTYTVSGLNVSLAGSGTYYLTLQNAVVQAGGVTPDTDPAYWDENDGPSAAFQDFESGSYYTLANNDDAAEGGCANGQLACTGSETFDVYGTTASATPEPGSSVLLGFGMLLLTRAWRRKVTR
jgi:hypothetical protein